MSAAPPPDSAAPSDAELLLGVARRDREAFVALFGRYAGRVKGYAMRAGTSASDADEIAQDVMVAVWRHAASFDPARAAPSTWIFAIARNRRIDAFRRSGRAVPDPLDPLFQPDPEPDGFQRLDAAEREARLRDAVAGLAPEQRLVLVGRLLRWAQPRPDRRARGPAARHRQVADPARLPPPHAILGEDLAEGMRR